MTQTTETETYEQFRDRVRSVAIRTADNQGWCDSGLNDVLRELGLNEKKTFIVPVEFNVTKRVKLPVNDAQSLEEAYAKLTESPEKTRKLIESYTGWPVSEFAIADPPKQPAADSGVPLPGQPAPEDGEWYATSVVSGGPNQCRVRAFENDAFYCTRPLGHAADWHVAAGKNAGVIEVWEAKEGDVRPDPAPEMPVADDDDDYSDEDDD